MNVQLDLEVNRTVTGPRVQFDPSAVRVEYDYERDDGSVEWAALEFHGVLSCHCWVDVCCPTELIGPFDSVVVVEASAEVLRCQEQMRIRLVKRDLDNDAKSFRIYFDSAAAIEIVAEKVTMGKVTE